MPGWGDLFGQGSPAGQLLLWQVGGQVIGTLLGPVLTEAQQELWQAAVSGSGGTVSLALSAETLADMVVRGIRTMEEATNEAGKTGVAPSSFAQLVHQAGEPPGLEFMLEAWRRGYLEWADTGLDTPSVERGVRTSRIYNYWTPIIQKMAVVPMGVAEAVDAVVEGQITYEEGEKAAYASGIDSPTFRILVNTRGNPPSPTELNELHRRGLIPLEGTGPDATSVQQGIYEGATKDKWWHLLAALAEYLPPPRTVTALEREGVITPQEAIILYKDAGLSDTLAAAYSAAATAHKTATHKALAESSVVQLYEGKMITAAKATELLTTMGYTAEEAGFILALADHNVTTKQLTAAVTKVRTLYVGRKIDAPGARKALADLGVPGDQVTALMATWDIEAATNVRDLTPAEILDAWELTILTQDEAEAELQALGYTPWDAWVKLSIKNKGPLPNPPAKGPGPSPAIT